MNRLETPILLTAESIGEFPNGFGFPAKSIDRTLEAKIADPNTRNGIYEAVELMLRESAVVIHWMDEADPGRSIRNGEEKYKKATRMLGFNDHFGGSESKFKLLLNRFFEDQEPSQYVLYSPPTEEGLPSNLDFHKSNFTFLSWEFSGTRDDLPNVLKTAGQAHSNGRNHHDFFLVGDADVPYKFSEAFAQAGFGFTPEPYEEDFEWELQKQGHAAKDRLGYTELRQWPNDQFATQIEQLRKAENGNT